MPQPIKIKLFRVWALLVLCARASDYVTGNQQITNTSSTGSLPALTERANGLNSRYLSAGSTASLAAAQVAAAASQPATTAAQVTSQQQHQQQQHQQQQASNAPPPTHHASPTQSPLTSASAQQYNNSPTVASQAGPPPPAPVMTSTYAFNPLTGQYGPAETGSGNWIQQLLAQQQQQQLQQQQQQQQQFNNFNNFVQRPRQPNYPQLPYGVNPNVNPFIFRSPQQMTFSRRGGASIQTNPLRLPVSQPNYQLTGSADDDLSNFNQQTGGYPNSLADQLAVSLGFQLQDINGQQQQQQQDFNGVGGLQSQSSLTSQQIAQPLFPAEQNYNQNKHHDQCVAADGRHGTCYQASECIRRGGTPMGRCGSSSSSSLQSGGGGVSSGISGSGGELSGSSHVCCLFDVSCGNQFAAERFVYFRNPNFPNTYDQPRMCRAKIGKLDKGVCQFRLDMLRFDIARPTNGNCSQDMFVVSGQNENYVIPKICGLNDGQHYYVGVDESGVITLHMMMMGFYRRTFEVLVTQIPCRSDYAAPAHCLQHFSGTHGTIKSFNYDDDQQLQLQQQQQQPPPQNSFVNYDLQPDGSSAPYGLHFAGGASSTGSGGQLQQRQALTMNRYQQQLDLTNFNQFGGYPNDLDYTICIRKESGFCSITYQLSRADSGQLSPFAVGVAAANIYNNNNNTNGDTLLSTTTSSVSTECRDDYLLIGGVRLCSGSAGQSAAGGVPFYDQQQQQNNNTFQQQQLLNQRDLLMQQLARLQQQAGSNQSAGQQQAGSGGQQLDQQQAAIMQQLMLNQQQLNLLANSQQQFNQQRGFNQQDQLANQFAQSNSQQDLQGAIITDTTSGPFLLRFVSNVARNARGFHIDYRQNPCK